MTSVRITTFGRDGLTFDVIDAGPVDGEPIVLLHGFPQRASAWGEAARILNEAGFRTLAPDQRGYSPGARPRPVSAYRTNELVADIAALIDMIGQPVHLVGHDWGAAVAWATAIERPELLRSLTAVSVGHPAAFIRALRTPEQLRRSYYMLLFQVRGLTERVISKPGGWGERRLRAAGMIGDIYANYQRDIVQDGALTGGLNWYRANAITLLREPHAPVHVPTTLVWSDGDAALGRPQAEGTAEHVTAPYEFVELNGVGHWLLDDRPADVAEAIIARARSRAANPG